MTDTGISLTQAMPSDRNDTLEILADGRHLRLVSANGWEYVQRTSARSVVAIIATTTDERLVLVEQHRPAVSSCVIELPAGLVGDEEDADESLLTAAVRELEEETGFVSDDWQQLWNAPSSPGLTAEVITFFRATGCRQVGAGSGVGSEDIRVHLVSPAEIADWLGSQSAEERLVDAKVYAGLWSLTRQRNSAEAG